MDHRRNPKIPSSGSNYRIQRITIDNVTLGLRWSEDAIDNEPAEMMNVIGAPGNEMRVTHNLTTYAVISLFGWGLGVFDVNAVESNEVPGTSPSGIVRAQKQVALRAYAGATAQADRVLRSGETGGTRWGTRYQTALRQGTENISLVRGNALQQITERLMANNRYVLEARRSGCVIAFNRGSRLGLRSRRGSLLRPDLQIGFPNGRWGILDLTARGQASKIDKYAHHLSPFMINVVY